MTVPKKEDAGFFSGIFKYRITAKAKWKDLRDLKPLGGKKKKAAAYFWLTMKGFLKAKSSFYKPLNYLTKS